MRGFFTVMVVAHIPISVIVGKTADLLARRMYKWGWMRKAGVLLVGVGETADMAEAKSEAGELGAYRVVRRALSPPKGADMRAFLAENFAAEPDIDAVFAFGKDMDADSLMELVVESALAGKYTKTVMPVYEKAVFIRHDWLGDERVIHFGSLREAEDFAAVQSVLCGFVAALSLVFLFVPHFIVSLLVKCDSRGGALFKQERYGLLGKKFTIFKYRTMCDGAEDKRDELEHLNENDGGLFKIKTDPRVTKTGYWLRKSSIDELPQVLNIVRGEMCFVGPRPLPCYDLDEFDDRWQSARFLSKPGLTGLWQVAGRAHVKFDEMCKMDIWYSLNRSFRLDVILLWKTIKTVVFGVGAY